LITPSSKNKYFKKIFIFSGVVTPVLVKTPKEIIKDKFSR